MTVWVMIMMISYKAIATQEFTSKERCEIAAAQFIEAGGWGSAARAVCVQK